MPVQPRGSFGRGGRRLLGASAFTALASLVLPAAASAADPCAVGKALTAAGDPADAKAVYVAALEAHPALACAAAGLKALTAGAGGTSITAWLTTVGADAGLASAVAVIAFTAAAIVFVGLTYARPAAAVLSWLMPWAYQPRLTLSPFSDSGEGSFAPGVTALVRGDLAAAAGRRPSRLDRWLRKRSERAKPRRRHPFTLDRLSGAETLADSIAELSDAVGQFKGIAAVFRFVGKAASLPHYTLSGTLQSAGPEGGGISLVLDRQHGSEDTATIWSGATSTSSAEDTKATDYLALAPGAAGWAEYTLRAREGLSVPQVTNDAISYAQLQLGLELDREGKAELARLAYRRAVDRDPHNVAALVNLGLNDARSERFDRAIRWLQRARDVIEKGVEEDVPTQPAFPETSLAAEWYHATYNLAAQYFHRALQSSESSHEKAVHPGRPADQLDAAEAEVVARGGLVAGLRLLVGDDGVRGSQPRSEPQLVRLPAKEAEARLSPEPSGQPGEPEDETKGAALATFVETFVVPATALLLADLLTRPGLAPPDRLESEPADRPSSPPSKQELLEALESGDTRSTLPGLLEAYALHGDPSYRTRYNAACLYAGRPGSGNEKCALKWLACALDAAPPREQAQLAAWANRDPSFVDLRKKAHGRFVDTVTPYLEPKHESEPDPQPDPKPKVG